MMEILQLRNLNNNYYRTNRHSVFEIYYDAFTNNAILFSPEKNKCNTESICNSINPQAYEYLMKVLNTTKNTVVVWSQCEGTTSDYTIFYNVDSIDKNLKSHHKLNTSLDFSKLINNAIGMKYTEVMNSVVNAVKF